MAATESSRVIAPSLAKRLGIEVNIAHGLIDRLEKEGFVKNAGKGKKLGKMVDKEKIMEEGMKKYFLQKAVISNEGTKVEETENIDSTDKHMEKITSMTESMELDGEKKPRKKKSGRISEIRQSPRLLQKKTDEDREIPQIQRKGKKRACSKIYENSEFEVADSQDVTADEDCHRSKKKASDVTRAILV